MCVCDEHKLRDKQMCEENMSKARRLMRRRAKAGDGLQTSHFDGVITEVGLPHQHQYQCEQDG